MTQFALPSLPGSLSYRLGDGLGVNNGGLTLLRLLIVLPAIFLVSTLLAYAVIVLIAAFWPWLLAGVVFVVGVFALAVHVAD